MKLRGLPSAVSAGQVFLVYVDEFAFSRIPEALVPNSDAARMCPTHAAPLTNQALMLNSLNSQERIRWCDRVTLACLQGMACSFESARWRIHGRVGAGPSSTAAPMALDVLAGWALVLASGAA